MWKKQHQILKYVNLLRANSDPNYKIDQPVLLSVITINKKSQINNNRIKIWAKGDGLSDRSKIATFNSNLEKTKKKGAMEKIKFEARFGVFLCIPKGDNKFCIALLWRHNTKTLKDASTQFGKILYAVQLCSHMSLNGHASLDYTYLGPNCCKIGNSVRNIALYGIIWVKQYFFCLYIAAQFFF